MIATLSIRAKMIAVISFFLAALAGMGLLATLKMQTIQASTIDIQNNRLPKVRVLGFLRAHTMKYGSVVRDHLLETEAPKKAANDEILKTLSQEIGKASAEYESLITSPEERALFDEFQQGWNAYVTQIQDVLSASRRNDFAEASHVLLDLIPPVRARSGQTLLQAIDLNNKGAEAAGRDATEAYASAFKMMVAIFGLAIVLGVCAGLLLVRDISRGIASIVKPMRALAAGELTAVVPDRSEKTEIGQMAVTLQVFKTALIAKKAADEAAAADSDVRVRRAQRIDEVTREFENMVGELVGSLSSASTELEAAAGTLSSTAEVTQQRAGSADAASRDVSDHIQAVAVASEQITSSVTEIGRQVQESSRIAQNAVKQAEKTNASIAELSLVAARIGDVVKLITAIAEQTNLLALNATIEAARAGEAGRGFAVVAAEVKALAAQTAKATDDIGTQITGMRSATEASVAAIKDINATIGSISEISSTIAAAVDEQGAATQEIARSMQQAAQLSAQVASNVTDVNRGTSETGSASAQVLSSARSLSKESTQLKIEVDKFLTTVRAA
jgi:methyl-accepting chemotaxis protein